MANGVETAIAVNTANADNENNRATVYQRISLTDEQKAHRKELQREAIAKYKGQVVHNGVDVCITATGIKEFLNQPHEQYFEKK